MTRIIYGFDDSGNKIPVGSYDDGLLSVGGRIFYIDSNSDETVEFYDANGNVLSNVAVGDTPAYYKVTSAGVSGKEKFYVYYDTLYSDNRWTYYENGNYVYESTGFTSLTIGAGRTNTAGIMTLHDGAYITNDPGGTPTIWYTIKNCRDTLLGGCSDWFIGSMDELEALRLFISDNISALGLTDLFTNQIWSSSEHDGNRARPWLESLWGWASKYYSYGVVPIRSF